MSASVKMIKFLTLLSGVFLILTFVIFLCMKMRPHPVQSGWVYGDLLFTLSSGAFASSLVVLLNEMRHYQTLKRDSQDQLFLQLASMYGQLLIMQGGMKRRIENPAESVPESLLDRPAYTCRQNVEFICNMDYTVFCPKEEISQMLKSFKDDKSRIEAFLANCLYLKMAINADQIGQLQESGVQGSITAQNYNTRRVLLRLKKRHCALAYKDE